MKLEISVTEVKEIIKGIQEQPEQLFELMRMDIRETVGQYLTELMKAELTHFLGRASYERAAGSDDQRNGFYGRHFTIKGVGKVNVSVPRDRRGDFQTQVLPRSKQYEEEISRDLSLMFLAGISTRSLSMMSERLIGRKISPTEISAANVELSEAVEKWRLRDLSKEDIQYLFIDGVNFGMRIEKSIEVVPVLVAIGVTRAGHKLVVGIQSGDKESASSWRQFYKDLKARGLDGSRVVLGIMDGLPGLEKVFREEFPKAKTQRCQVHVARNVIAKVPKKLKQDVADDLRSIFYASSREKAMTFFEQFRNRWIKDIPSAVACLEGSIDACLTFFHFPEEEWISMRTTNVIERLNKEFKRRTRPMEILAGEAACYRLLTFISLKMELNWRSNPVGKVRKNLPFFNEMAYKQFTHNN